MRKYSFTEMNVYLSLFDENRIVHEYNNMANESNYIYFTKDIDEDLNGMTPSKIVWLTCGGYFSMKSPYYIIDSDGNAVSIDECNVLYVIVRRLTLPELFKLCQKFGIEKDLQ